MQEQDNNRIPSSLRAAIEARKNAEKLAKQHQRIIGSMEKLVRPSQKMANILMKQQNYIDRMQKLFEPPRVITEMILRDKIFAEKMRKLAEPPEYITNIQKSIARWERIDANFTKSLKRFAIPDHTSDLFQKLLEPSLSAQKITERISKLYNWEDAFSSLAESLTDFKPTITTIDNSIVIEEDKFTADDINQIAEDYIWNENSEKNIFTQDAKKLSWNNIPKPIRWLIALIIATIFTIYFTAIWKEATRETVLDPEVVARKLVHFRKQEVRKIAKSHQNKTSPPFVNTEYLLVHSSPRRKSHAFAALSYPYEVKILKFRHKKRWILIEWENENDEVTRGWVLGRYIYR